MYVAMRQGCCTLERLVSIIFHSLQYQLNFVSSSKLFLQGAHDGPGLDPAVPDRRSRSCCLVCRQPQGRGGGLRGWEVWMTRSMELDVVGDSLRLPQSSVDEREGHTDPDSFSEFWREWAKLIVCLIFILSKFQFDTEECSMYRYQSIVIIIDGSNTMQ